METTVPDSDIFLLTFGTRGSMLPIHETSRAFETPSPQKSRAAASKSRADPRPALHGASRFFRSPRFAPGALRGVAGTPGRRRPSSARMSTFRCEPADLLLHPGEVRRKRKQRTVAGQTRTQGAVETFRRCVEICAHTVRSSAGGLGCRTGSPDRIEVRHFDSQEDNGEVAERVPVKKKPLRPFSPRHGGAYVREAQIRLARSTRDCVAGFWLRGSPPSRAMCGGADLCRSDCMGSSHRIRPISSFPSMRPRVLAGVRDNNMSKNFCLRSSVAWRVRSTSVSRNQERKE